MLQVSSVCRACGWIAQLWLPLQLGLGRFQNNTPWITLSSKSQTLLLGPNSERPSGRPSDQGRAPSSSSREQDHHQERGVGGETTNTASTAPDLVSIHTPHQIIVSTSDKFLTLLSGNTQITFLKQICKCYFWAKCQKLNRWIESKYLRGIHLWKKNIS